MSRRVPEKIVNFASFETISFIITYFAFLIASSIMNSLVINSFAISSFVISFVDLCLFLASIIQCPLPVPVLGV